MSLTAEVLRPTPNKFSDPETTAKGEKRAIVSMKALETLWFNTGTICNLACSHCYIESSPENDDLIYLRTEEVVRYLDELEELDAGQIEIGFTGGEPFMNPSFPEMLEACLQRGHRVLVLTNAMRPMMKQSDHLQNLQRRWGEQLTLRISLDHYTQSLHDEERGEFAWQKTMPGVQWLVERGFSLQVAGRTCWPESEEEIRQGFANLFEQLDLQLDADNPAHLVLFPEMDEGRDVPEITDACWGILDVSPDNMMCATSRMIVHRKGEPEARIAACTLLPYDPQFDLGSSLGRANTSVSLNHPFCSEFCVLGGASCSA
ncbi:MAG: radical SAM protein [Alphaproteobacteria bacterium]|jgi:hypothetical protein|nr:radical SAM protein [Alphaproteobacteria bacterium]MBT4082345.1 radical SAM protein [Alphaproteobacteria bacterium]MBT4545447.1 radical SAM protein [Alphaproteobacteria bacterium]MBT7746447.1 radical SAM protein [Alphaproteobacteria bacterium]